MNKKIQEARRVYSTDWTPKRNSTHFRVIELLAATPGMRMKELAYSLGKTNQSTWRALIGNRDAELIANVGGKRGYFLTKKGIKFAKKSGINFITPLSKEQVQATQAAADSKRLPNDIENIKLVLKAMPNGLISTSGLGKRITNIKLGGLGNAYKREGNRAKWTFTVHGRTLGGVFKVYDAFTRKNRGRIRMLTNPKSISLKEIRKAMVSVGLKDIKNFKIIGWQSDATMDDGGDDVVIGVTSSLLPALTGAKEVSARAKRRQPDNIRKRTQKLLKRASRGSRLGSVGRALRIAKRFT